MGSPFSGCVKSETGKKRPSAKIDGTRSRALRGATEAKSGVKSGGFWQPLSQDVALFCNVVRKDSKLGKNTPSLLAAWTRCDIGVLKSAQRLGGVPKNTWKNS
jgi:hypothetical protein